MIVHGQLSGKGTRPVSCTRPKRTYMIVHGQLSGKGTRPVSCTRTKRVYIGTTLEADLLKKSIV
ncbi:hypothetical protein BpHYR1_042831 [Brachionus plicatilis]|uniref:Uncharacterized protein n=1 Tax=Brachionus plicatilis TaxID=10195 RepID=A0A3M7QHL1_BRAPC|nr:hypothetical protein BpHYR1_042831 [Brachionus plicatilis]